jgi:hypothetical protein
MKGMLMYEQSGMDKAGLRKEYLRRDTSEFSMEKKANEVVVLDRLWDGRVFWGRTREWNILMTQARVSLQEQCSQGGEKSPNNAGKDTTTT